jgi:Na+/H+ antiporter NhaA
VATTDATRRFAGTTAWARQVAAPLRSFLETEAGSAVVLLAAALMALVWANLGSSYEDLWTTKLSVALGGHRLDMDLRAWVNDGLMALFFFVIGLEIRRELDMGELRERRRVAVPMLAALGGMVLPALIFTGIAGGKGWGVVIASDTAFVLGVLALIGRRCPVRLRVFMLTLMIGDDIAALLVIAGVYTAHVAVGWLAVALSVLAAVLLLRRFDVRRGPLYWLLGFGMWVAVHESGVNPTLTGVALGLIVTAYPPSRPALERAAERWREFREQPTPELARSAGREVALTISPNERLQAIFHPWTSYVVVPLFALANAGIDLGGGLLGRAATSSLTLGIVLALVLGKLVGISGSAWLATRARVGLPLPVSFPALVCAAGVAGIGFTISLFVANLAFTGERLEEAKAGVLAASVIASALGWAMFAALDRLPESVKARATARTALPIEDLDLPVDRELDHYRGSLDAPVTLVEYGDFECPYCGRAEPVLRELVSELGADLCFVFRHLPLPDVHEHAQLAAEAAEAAAAQGRFWEMHDKLMTHQDALAPDDLMRYADELGLDVDRFWEDARTRRFAPRVARDVASADRSGVAGTPTFFVNGRRHQGAYDLETLKRTVLAAKTAAERRATVAAPTG